MAHVQKRNGKWQARYRDASGREHARRFDRKVDAQRWIDAAQGDLLRGAWVDPAAGRITVRDFAATWLELQVWRDSTRDNVNHSLGIILPALGDRPLVALTKPDIQRFVNAIDLAPVTVAGVHQHLRTMLGAAVEAGRIVRNPAVGVKLPEIVRPHVVPLSPEQVWMLAEAAPPFLRAAVVLGAGLGLRQGEAMGLTVDRVDWLAGRHVRVDRQLVTPNSGAPKLGPPKTRASFRNVPASAVVLEALSAHLQAYGTGAVLDATGKPVEGLVFHVNGKPIGRNRFGDLWRATVKRAGLPHGTRYHDTRHHFASALIAANCSVKAVQDALGHASARETLDTYGHLWPADHDRIRAAVEATLQRPPADNLRTAGT